MSSSPSPARVVATRVLHRVDVEGSWATPSLDAEIARARLDVRDAALATEIAYGALRVVPALDAVIASALDRPGRAVEPFARAALRAAAYQLLHLDAPSHAIVSDTVAIVRGARGGGLAGFVNAVSRRVSRDRPSERRTPDRVLLPDWLDRALRRSLGDARAQAFATLRELPPPIGLRVAVERISRGELAQRMREAVPRAAVREGEASELALLVRRAGDPRALPGYDDGLFAVQEQGAQVVAAALGALPGETIADVCAGRGGKTTYLARQVGDAGAVVALDVSEQRLDAIASELDRLKIPRARVDAQAVDLTVGTAGLEGRFDRVLVDAPCTGLGTVQRRPEILLRMGPDDPARLAGVQRAILRNAVRLAKPGGVIAYAVCSPLDAEGREVVAWVLDAEPSVRLERSGDEDGIVRIGPWLDECDGYQVARLRREVES